jgi:hypothetical protein
MIAFVFASFTMLNVRLMGTGEGAGGGGSERVSGERDLDLFLEVGRQRARARRGGRERGASDDAREERRDLRGRNALDGPRQRGRHRVRCSVARFSVLTMNECVCVFVFVFVFNY